MRALRDDAQVGADGQVTQMDDSVADKNKGRWMRSQEKGGSRGNNSEYKRG